MLVRIRLAVVGLLLLTTAAADDVSEAKVLLCSTLEVAVCESGGICLKVLPEQLNVPLFVEVDIKKRTLSATEASGETRKTVADSLRRSDGQLVIQGYENGRAFSMIIEEDTGYSSFASVADLASEVIFGACTPLK